MRVKAKITHPTTRTTKSQIASLMAKALPKTRHLKTPKNQMLVAGLASDPLVPMHFAQLKRQTFHKERYIPPPTQNEES